MQYEKLSENPFYREALKNFMKANGEVHEYDDGIKPGMVKDYEKSVNDMAGALIKLAEFGADIDVDENDIGIECGDDTVLVDKKLIEDAIGMEKFRKYFGQEAESEAVQDEEATSGMDEDSDADYAEDKEYPEYGDDAPVATDAGEAEEFKEEPSDASDDVADDAADFIKAEKKPVDARYKGTPVYPMPYQNPYAPTPYYMGMNPYFAMMASMMPPMGMPQYGAPVQGYGQPHEMEKDANSEGILKDIKTLQMKAASLKKEKDAVEKRSESYKEQIEELKRKIGDLSAEIDGIKNEYEAAAKSFETERDAKDQEIDRLQSELSKDAGALDASEARKKEIEEALDKAEKEKAEIKSSLEKAERKATEASADKEAREKAIENLKAAKEEAEKFAASVKEKAEIDKKKYIGQSEEGAKALRDRIDKAEKELADTKQKLSAAEKKARESEGAAQDKVKDMAAGLKKATGEVEALKKEVESAKAEAAKATEGAAGDKKELEELRASKEVLMKLAYNDKKTGVMNENAFNRDLKAADKNSIVLAKVSISSMKLINMNLGMKKGDNAIKNVAGMLAKDFGSKSVYRAYGDQFFIIASGSKNSIREKLNAIRERLRGEEIYVSFGVSAGADAAGDDKAKISGMIGDVTVQCNAMKDGSVEDTDVVPSEEPYTAEQAGTEPAAGTDKVGNDDDEEDDDSAIEQYMNG